MIKVSEAFFIVVIYNKPLSSISEFMLMRKFLEDGVVNKGANRMSRRLELSATHPYPTSREGRGAGH